MAECMLCGCTESMACIEAAGVTCSWISQEPHALHTGARVWKVVQALSNHPGAAGSFQALKRACCEHREEGYVCG